MSGAAQRGNTRRALTALATGLLALTSPLLTGCSSDDTGTSNTGTNSSSASQQPAPATVALGDEGALVLEDAWAKAGEAGGMTSVFGTLENRADEPLSISGLGSTSEAAETVELHEIVNGQMRAVEQEIVLQPGERLELTPGGHHLMLMGLTDDLLPGDEIELSLLYGEGGDPRQDIGYESVLTALVKDYAGANEEYGGDSHGDDSHDGGSHDEHGTHDNDHEH